MMQFGAGITSHNPTETQWEKELCEKVMNATKTATERWCSVVATLSVPSTIREKWTSTYVEQVEDLYEVLCQDINDYRNETLNEIESLLAESSKLCAILGIEIPQFGEKNLGMYEEKKLLEKRNEGYREQINKINEEINVLKQRQDTLCKMLGRLPKRMPEAPLPSEQYMEDFKGYLEALESEKFERLENFFHMKSLIVELAGNLKYKPTLEFERLVMFSADANFCVTDENMKGLKEFHKRLNQQYEELTERITAEREKVKHLWEVLEQEPSYCNEFLKKHTGLHIDTLNSLKMESKRCDEIKRANIEVFVKRLRKQLLELWNKCHLTEEQREKFEYFKDELYTEDLLSLHDIEIKNMEKYYNTNKELFGLLVRYRNLWTKVMEFENREIGLESYKNRGGQLLKEEKQRNVLSKEIPKVEAELQMLAKNYENENGKPFLSWGKRVNDIIETAHYNREQIKMEKKLKLSERKQQRDKTLTPAKSTIMLSRCPSTQNLKLTTPSSTKRKLITTPLLSSKRKCLGEITEAATTSKKNVPKIQLNGQNMSSSRRYSRERGKRIKRIVKRLSQKARRSPENQNNGCISPLTDYDEFENKLNKENVRSTAFHMNDSDLARPLPATSIQQTPLTTPRRTPRALSKQRTPRTASKLTTAPALKLLF